MKEQDEYEGAIRRSWSKTKVKEEEEDGGANMLTKEQR